MTKTIALFGIMLLLTGCTLQNSKDERCYQKGKAVPEVKPGETTCFGMYNSYYYDPDQKKCASIGISGCGVDSPFESLEECQSVCEN